ncbi:MAG: protein of unknown function DUF507 [uncultured bacterium]|nr:MAG: protein of unknown function DUF507 [uncultured bacterium]
MRLSEDRISNISHKIHDRIYLDELIDFKDEDEALKIIKKTMTDFLQMDDVLDDFVRKKIATLKKGVMEGTPEWDVMYRKYFEEELTKKGM